MADNLSVARPYAKAVFNTALEHDKLEQWSKLLNTLVAIATDNRVQQFLTTPSITWQQRADLFTDVCKELSPNEKNFIKVLALNQRLTVLPDILTLFENLSATRAGVVKAKVITFKPLTEQQKTKLKQALEKRLQSKVELEEDQDPTILGGLKIYIGNDRVIDGSVRGELDQLTKILA